MRLPGIVGILFLIYLGALLYAPHPSGWEHVLREIALWTGLMMLFVVFLGALAIGAKAIVARVARVFRGEVLGTPSPPEPSRDAISPKKGFFAKFAGGVEHFIINFVDLSSATYWYAVVFAYETYNMSREHSYVYAAYSFLCCAVLGIDSIIRLAKEPGFFNRLWFGYMFLGLVVLTVCLDASKPDHLASIIFDVIFFGALSFAGFYGHYRANEGIDEDAIGLIARER